MLHGGSQQQQQQPHERKPSLHHQPAAPLPRCPAYVLQESPAWPVLVQCCAARGIRLGLLNARMSSRAFLSWFQPRVSRGLLRRMLGHFSLIVPQSDIVSVARKVVFLKRLCRDIE